MTVRESIVLASVLAIALGSGCSDDDSQPNAGSDPDGGPDSGRGNTGNSGSSAAGNSSSTAGTGSGPRAGTGSRAGSGADEDGGPGADASGMGTDGGGGTSGSGDAATADGGGTVTQPGCAGLSECCAGLSQPDRGGCDVIADNADDAMCDQLIALFCMPTPGDATSCPDLDACCETLPRGPVRVACATTAMNSMPSECEQLTAALCPEGGDPNACASLTDCCEALPPPQAGACNAIAAQGVAGSCEAVESLLCP